MARRGTACGSGQSEAKPGRLAFCSRSFTSAGLRSPTSLHSTFGSRRAISGRRKDLARKIGRIDSVVNGTRDSDLSAGRRRYLRRFQQLQQAWDCGPCQFQKCANVPDHCETRMAANGLHHLDLAWTLRLYSWKHDKPRSPFRNLERRFQSGSNSARRRVGMIAGKNDDDRIRISLRNLYQR